MAPLSPLRIGPQAARSSLSISCLLKKWELLLPVLPRNHLRLASRANSGSNILADVRHYSRRECASRLSGGSPSHNQREWPTMVETEASLCWRFFPCLLARRYPLLAALNRRRCFGKCPFAQNPPATIQESCKYFARRANHFCFSEIMSSLFCKNISVFAGPKSDAYPGRPVPKEGRCARHQRGAGCGGRGQRT